MECACMVMWQTFELLFNNTKVPPKSSVIGTSIILTHRVTACYFQKDVGHLMWYILLPFSCYSLFLGADKAFRITVLLIPEVQRGQNGMFFSCSELFIEHQWVIWDLMLNRPKCKNCLVHVLLYKVRCKQRYQLMQLVSYVMPIRTCLWCHCQMKGRSFETSRTTMNYLTIVKRYQEAQYALVYTLEVH